ncbi:MAG: hypothetical protein JWN78_2491 [Bacteroidota bacterium]|nr:hypothetical protein [Bacteroidota bacterium]
MIDGGKYQAELDDFAEWKAATNLTFYNPTDTTGTGEIQTYKRYNEKSGDSYYTVKHTALWRKYRLDVNEVIKEDNSRKFYLNFRGSFHKSSQGGSNWKLFTFNALADEAEIVCSKLKLNPRKIKIQNIELGVNIHVSFNPSATIGNSFINYQNQPFCPYSRDKTGKKLGAYCELSHHTVKCYDKGLQYDLPYFLLRFEDKWKVMQKLRCTYGITTVDDLLNYDKVYKLKELLITAWDDVLVFERINTEGLVLTSLQKHLQSHGDNHHYWTALKEKNRRKMNYQRNVLRRLIDMHGKGYHAEVRNKIEQEWELCFR